MLRLSARQGIAPRVVGAKREILCRMMIEVTNKLLHVLRWHAARAADRWGAEAIAGVALTLTGGALAVAAYLGETNTRREAATEMAQLEAQVSALRAAARSRNGAPAAAPATRGPRPDTQALAATLGGAARRAAVQLDDMSLDAVVEGAPALRATISAQGTYAQFRRFVGMVLNENPRLVLLELQLSPHEGAPPRLDGHLVFLSASDGP